jgi:tRNA threonylcarbamoyladenosine biosynthesis protein TsaE
MNLPPVPVTSAVEMADLGRRIAGLLRAGDLVVLEGPLGAGKTTLARGLGAALGVRGEVTSPTFVIARRHRSEGAGPALLHIDAYRTTAVELLDQELDLEAADCVTLVEWGAGKVEDWSRDRLLISIQPQGDDPDGPRLVRVQGTGERWAGLALTGAVDAQ